MAKIQTVEAVVLGSRNFEEADRLLTLFTLQLGKITVIAKGVRRITSKRGGNLDILNCVTVTLVTGRSLRIVTEAQVINAYPNLKDNLSKAFYAYYILELVNSLTVEEQEHPDIFLLLKQVLTLFSKEPRRILITAFEIKLLSSLGFWNDQILSSLDIETIAKAKQLRVQSFGYAGTLKLSDHDMMEIEEIVRKCLAIVAEKEFRSPQILQKLKLSLKQAQEN